MNEDDVRSFFAENPDGYLAGEEQELTLTHADDGSESLNPILLASRPIVLFRDIYDDYMGRGWGPYVSISGVSKEFLSKIQPDKSFCKSDYPDRHSRIAYASLEVLPNVDGETLKRILRFKEAGMKRISKPAVDPLRQVRAETNRANAEHFNGMFRPGRTLTQDDIEASIQLLKSYSEAFIQPKLKLVHGAQVEYRVGEGFSRGTVMEAFEMQNKVIVEKPDSTYTVISSDSVERFVA